MLNNAPKNKKNVSKNTGVPVVMPAVVGGVSAGFTAGMLQAGGFLSRLSIVTYSGAMASSYPALASGFVVGAPVALAGFSVVAVGALTYKGYVSYCENAVLNELRHNKLAGHLKRKGNATEFELEINSIEDNSFNNLCLLIDGHCSSINTVKNCSIVSIKINSEHISLDHIQKLLKAGLGLLQVKNLEISQTRLGDGVVLALESEIMQGGFETLESLNLQNNQLTSACLPNVISLATKLKLQLLDLSDNPLNTLGVVNIDLQNKVFADFFGNFSRNFPYAHSLSLRSTNLTDERIKDFKSLFGTIGSLTFLDISKNFNLNPTSALLNSIEFQSNLNFEKVETGFSNNRKITDPIKKRMALVNNLRNSLSLKDDDSLTLKLLSKFLSSDVKRYLGKNKKIFNIKATEQKTLKEKWLHFSRRFQDFMSKQNRLEIKNVVEKKSFESYLKLSENDSKFMLCELFNGFYNADNDQVLDLIVNEGSLNIYTYSEIEPELDAVLFHLSNEDLKPKITNLKLIKLDLTSNQLSNWIGLGLGDYQSEHLDLSHNKLTDVFLNSLVTGDSFEHIKSLNLSHNLLTVDGLASLAAFASRVNLESLDISDNQFTLGTLQQKNSLIGFFEKLYDKVPTLRSLKLRNIGLDDETAGLLQPLLVNESLLETLDISQSTVKRHKTFVDLLNDLRYKSNITLNKVTTGRDNVAHLKKQLNEKASNLEKMTDTLTAGEREAPLLTSVLSQYLRKTPMPFQESIDGFKDNVVYFTSNEFQRTHDQKLRASSRHLQYFRDLALIKDKKFLVEAPVLSEEWVALRKNRLTVYWNEKIKNNPLDLDGVEEIKSRSMFCNQALEPLKAFLLIDTALEGMSERFKVFYCEDFTVRVVNTENKKQYIMPRYGMSLGLAENDVFFARKSDLTINVYKDSTFEFFIKGKLSAKVEKDLFCITGQKHANYNFNVRFHEFEVVEDLATLDVGSPIMNAYQRQQGQNQQRREPLMADGAHVPVPVRPQAL